MTKRSSWMGLHRLEGSPHWRRGRAETKRAETTFFRNRVGRGPIRECSSEFPGDIFKVIVMNSNVINVASDETLVKDAYGRVKGDWAVLAADQLLQVNLDVQVASQTILGALPEIKALRERMVKELSAFNVTQFD